MPWPWVPRSRFEDLQKRCEELEAERRTLWDRVLELSQQKPLYSAPVVPAVVPEEKSEDVQTPAPRTRLHIKDVREAANKAAEKAASGVGPSLWGNKQPKVANVN